MLEANPTLGRDAVTRLRLDTPAVDGQTFLNSAGSSLPPAPVLEAQVAHLAREAVLGGYRAAQEAADALEQTRRDVGALVGAAPEEVALLTSATEAWRQAFYGHDFQPGEVILTARATYGSNAIAMLQVCRRTGAQLEVVPDGPDGRLDLTWLEERLARGGVRFMALTHVPTGEGLVNPAADVGRLCRTAGVPVLLDACQSVGQLPLDLDALGCDMLSGTGRKFLRGPRGTGFLVVRRDYQHAFEPPMLDNVSADWTELDTYTVADTARRYEQFEGAIAARIGLGVAARYALDVGVAPMAARIGQLAERLRAGLRAHGGVSVHDRGAVRCGIVTFSVAGLEAYAVKGRLREQGIETSVTEVGSYRLGMAHRGLTELNRASPHAFNTEAEVDRCAAAVGALAAVG